MAWISHCDIVVEFGPVAEISGVLRALPIITIGLAIAGAPAAYAQQNLVQNPGFEETQGQGSSATSPDWTVTSGFGTEFLSGQQEQGGPNSGLWYASFAAISASEATSGTLSQMIPTTPGVNYVVSFFLANYQGPHNTFLATFGGQTVLSLTDSPAFAYTQYSAVVTATSSQTQLAFAGEQDPASFGLDDVSVEVQGAPAPVTGGGIASFALVLSALTARRMRAKAERA
jgi:hypothetical protein